MRKKDPDTKDIAGLECISRAKAAEYLEMSLSIGEWVESVGLTGRAI